MIYSNETMIEEIPYHFLLLLFHHLFLLLHLYVD
jgi:hypothetical protein